MLARELTYQMPFKRLVKVSRLASRKAFGSPWLLFGGLFLVYFVAFAILAAFERPINDWLASLGLPALVPVLPIVLGLVIAIWWLRHRALNMSKDRADYDSAVRFREEADGLRFATSEIEYFLRWNGISQLILIETQGLMVSHGNLFFLIPNEAFRDTGERDVLTQDVFARLGDKARARSVDFIPPAFIAAGGTART